MRFNKVMFLALILMPTGTLFSAEATLTQSDAWKGCKQVLAGSLLLSLGFNISQRGHPFLAVMPIYDAIQFITKGLENIVTTLNYEPIKLSRDQESMILKLAEEKLMGRISINDYEVGLKRILNNEIRTFTELGWFLNGL